MTDKGHNHKDQHVNVFIIIYVCLNVKPVLRSKDYVQSQIKIGYVVCLYTRVSPSVPGMESNMPLRASFFEDVPLVECIYLVYTPMPGGVIVGNSGLCCA